MPLESCVICLDNSEWMRNSDYSPTRITAQYDLVSMLVSAKLRDNPESTVGLLTTAGNNGVDVLASPTLDQGKLLGQRCMVYACQEHASLLPVCKWRCWR